MEEIEITNNPTGRKVYVADSIEMSDNEYDLLVSMFADKIDDFFQTQNGQVKNYDKEEKNDAV